MKISENVSHIATLFLLDELNMSSNISTTWIDSYSATSPKKEELDQAVVKMIAKDMQPISIVEDQGFTKFCHAMNPKYVLPSRGVISKTLIPTLFDEVQGKLARMLKMAPWVSFTTNLWTSVNGTSFLAITVHFWDNDLSFLQCFVLDCWRILGRHTAEHLGDENREMLIRYNIFSKIVVGVTDNGANIVKAFQEINIKQVA